MKEFDESDAIKAMSAVLAPERADEDAVFEVLDLIFEYYDEEGLTDISLDDEDNDDIDPDVEAVTDYVMKQLRRHRASVDFTVDEVKAMVEAEMAYEETLL